MPSAMSSLCALTVHRKVVACICMAIDFVTQILSIVTCFGNYVNGAYSLGCGSFFCTEVGGGKLEGKNGKEEPGHESQEEQTATQRADPTGERSTGRRAGNDPVAQRAPQSDVGRDRSRCRRADEPGTGPTAPGPGADGRERGLA